MTVERKTARFTSQWTCVGDITMHAQAAGMTHPGSPVAVLVHGLGVSSRYMRPLLAAMAPFTRVFAVDLPGFGKSSKPSKALDVPDLADALLGWLDARSLVRPVLYGNSFGCQVIVDLASRHPERVGRLVLMGPTTDPERRSAWKVVRWLLDAPREPPSLPLVMLRDVLDCGLPRVLATFQHMLADPIEDKLSLVTVPTLVLWGERDPIVSQRWVEEATALLPRGSLAIVPGAGHTVNYNSPDEIVRLTQQLFAVPVNAAAWSAA